VNQVVSAIKEHHSTQLSQGADCIAPLSSPTWCL